MHAGGVHGRRKVAAASSRLELGTAVLCRTRRPLLKMSHPLSSSRSTDQQRSVLYHINYRDTGLPPTVQRPVCIQSHVCLLVCGCLLTVPVASFRFDVMASGSVPSSPSSLPPFRSLPPFQGPLIDVFSLFYYKNENTFSCRAYINHQDHLSIKFRPVLQAGWLA